MKKNESDFKAVGICFLLGLLSLSSIVIRFSSYEAISCFGINTFVVIFIGLWIYLSSVISAVVFLVLGLLEYRRCRQKFMVKEKLGIFSFILVFVCIYIGYLDLFSQRVDFVLFWVMPYVGAFTLLPIGFSLSARKGNKFCYSFLFLGGPLLLWFQALYGLEGFCVAVF